MEIIGYRLRDFRSLQWGQCFRRCTAANPWWIRCRVHRGETSRRGRHQPASVTALRFPTRSCYELHSHRKVWSGSESRGVYRCSQHFFSVVTIPLVFWLILSKIPYLVLTTNSAYYKRICSCRYACSSESVETGNPVRIWDCPAAVSRNESRHKHWLSHELGSDGE
jgi:hypothetical protein